MLHRVFIAIHLPESVKTELLSHTEKWRDPPQRRASPPARFAARRAGEAGLPCKWTAKENLHITLVFLGNTSDTELQEILKILHEVAPRHSPFSVELSHIAYGPSLKDPKMVWVEGKPSKELLVLQKDIEKAFANSKILHFVEEKRPWALHLTLGRLKELEFRHIDPEERPNVEEEISLSFPVHSIEIMESVLKRGGAQYSICESILLA